MIYQLSNKLTMCSILGTILIVFVLVVFQFSRYRVFLDAIASLEPGLVAHSVHRNQISGLTEIEIEIMV